MIYKKFLLLTVFFCVFSVLIIKSQNLYVIQPNNTQITYTFNDIKNLSFIPGSLQINKKNGDTNTFNYSNIRFVSYFNYFSNISHPCELCENNFEIFPNPVNEILNIDLKVLNSETILLVIYDIKGKEVFKDELKSIDNFIQLNVSQFNKGLYLIQLYNTKKFIYKKFIKN